MDCVVVLVKSAQTRQAMSTAMSLLGPETTVLSMQNGLGHEDILSDIVGCRPCQPLRVMACQPRANLRLSDAHRHTTCGRC